MILRRIFVIAFALFTVTLNTACPHDIAAAVAEESNLRKEWNDKKDRADVIERDLWKNHNTWIGTTPDKLTTVSWAATPQAERTQVRALLNEYLSVTGRLIELADHKALKDSISDYTRAVLRENKKSAEGFVTSLDNYEGTVKRITGP